MQVTWNMKRAISNNFLQYTDKLVYEQNDLKTRI